jgi:hypothetical protein
LTEKLDTNNGSMSFPRWRNTTSLSYQPGDRHTISLSGLTIAGHQKADPTAGNLPTYTSFDLGYEYNGKSAGTFTAGIRDLMGTTPPVDETNTTMPLDTTLYSMIGREFIVGYRKTF